VLAELQQRLLPLHLLPLLLYPVPQRGQLVPLLTAVQKLLGEAVVLLLLVLELDGQSISLVQETDLLEISPLLQEVLNFVL
jgi:hypothetical protein